MFKLCLTISMLVIVTALSGCGTPGPLYIPEQRYPLPTQDEVQKVPAVPSEAAPDNQNN